MEIMIIFTSTNGLSLVLQSKLTNTCLGYVVKEMQRVKVAFANFYRRAAVRNS